MAHITGGGMIDNIPRVLPEGLAVHLDRKSWTVPPIFKLIQDKGNVDQSEMFRVFNMGIGMVLICAPDDVSGLIGQLSGASVIGEVVQQAGKERVVIE
jgi:phosphoribosylformylglycinamidine cyclo-ligase